MNDFDVPIIKKVSDLYKLLHSYRNNVPKQDRFTIFEHCEQLVLEVLEALIQAGGEQKSTKVPTLEHCSVKLNMLRVFVRLTKDVKAIDTKKYIAVESIVDEIGRMLGGWIKSVRVS